MKLKLTILFLILATVFIYFVFKGSDFSFIQRNNQATQELLTSNTVFDKFFLTQLQDYQGKRFSISEASLTGYQAVIIHLWASWCGPCVGEVPELIEFSKKHQEVKFIIISVDESKDDIAKFLISFPEFNSEKYIKIWDKESAFSKFFNVDRLPMSIILRNDKNEPQFIRSVVDWQSLKL